MVTDKLCELAVQAGRLVDVVLATGGDLSGAQLRAAVLAANRLTNAAAAVRAAAVAELAARESGPDGHPDDFTACEVGAALGYATAAATAITEHSLKIVRDLPTTLAAMTAGEMDPWRAHAIATELRGADPALCRQVEALVYPRVTGDTARAAAGRVRRALATVAPELVAAAKERARSTRELRVLPCDDGMSEWLLRLTADQSAVCLAAVESRAAELRAGDASLAAGAARADAAVDLMLGSAFVTTTVHLTLPVEALAAGAVSDDPTADAFGVAVPGVGIISDHAVADLVTTLPATITRVLFDQQTGTVIETGCAAYAPSRRVAAMVRLRDGTCRFPSCGRTAQRCDLDHVVPWPIGQTKTDNLAALCRRHHRAKTHAGWRYALRPDGRCDWTSPTGASYTTYPVDHRERAA